jgi:hypothetical protein
MTLIDVSRVIILLEDLSQFLLHRVLVRAELRILRMMKYGFVGPNKDSSAKLENCGHKMDVAFHEQAGGVALIFVSFENLSRFSLHSALVRAELRFRRTKHGLVGSNKDSSAK